MSVLLSIVFTFHSIAMRICLDNKMPREQLIENFPNLADISKKFQIRLAVLMNFKKSWM